MPRSKLTVIGHPLKPSEGSTFHVEGSNSQAFVFWGQVVFENLGDVKDPTQGISTIKTQNFELHGVRRRKGNMRWISGKN